MKIIKGKKIVFILLYFYIVYCDKETDSLNPSYKCGRDIIEPIPLSSKNILPLSEKSSTYKRSLDSDGFKDFNIFLDLYNFDEEIKEYKLQSKRELFVNGMQRVVKTLKSLLKVKELQNNYYFFDEHLTKIFINKWDKTKIGNETVKQNKGMKDLDIDLYIFIRFADNEELGKNVLASAGVRYLDGKTGQPLLGVVNINREVNYSKRNSLQYFESLIIHEFTHILGFSKYYFINYFKNYFIKYDKYGIKREYVNSTKVVKVAKKYFNCNKIEGVELENDGQDSATSGSHWEGRILLGDYMNAIIYTEDQVISEFTLALLEDSGYYKANYYTGGLMQFGRNKGCDFLNSKCIINGNINPKFSNEFFDKINNDYSYVDTSCSSGRQSRSYHLFYIYPSIPKEYQYFNSISYGGWDGADYCPVSLSIDNEEYYVGHCSEKGSGKYGTSIPYKDQKNNIITYESGNLKSITGELRSSNSFCALSTLISKTINNFRLYSNTLRAVCYQMHCSDKSLTIQINNNFIVCPRSGGKINAVNFDGYILCPDYNLICSGTVLCNDMFDCVEKKSLLKEVIYDYEIKTSQDYDIIENENIIEDRYELSINGKCPQNCSQCNENGYCFKCKIGYGPVEIKKNNKIATDCRLISELKIGYYVKEGIYYKCIDNCEICENENKCLTCISGMYSENGGSKCTKCPGGKYSLKGVTYCSNCPEGKYSLEGWSFCLNCPAGTYSNKGASQCKKCWAGSYSLSGASTCIYCPAGYYSLEGASSCIKCSPGYHSGRGSSRCNICPSGKYSVSDLSSCAYCPAGSYSKQGSSSCTTCPAGTYSYQGSSSCFQCSAGYYSPAYSSKCYQCNAGEYSNIASGSCTKCPAGTYSNKGASQCKKCWAGSYSSTGASTCTYCPAGYYSLEGAPSCNICPAGTYSSKGSKVCYGCKKGKTSKPGSSYCY